MKGSLGTPAYDAWIEGGRRLFTKECAFHSSSDRMEILPPPTLPEVVFAGRSNVGKSSLLNALTFRNKLARTSSTPGRTQAINFFDLAHKGFLVDIPGYGYAAASQEKISTWSRTIERYLTERPTIKRVYVLIDSRHGLKPSDLDVFRFLDRIPLSYQILMTKADKISGTAQAEVKAATHETLKAFGAAHPEILFVSSTRKEGLEVLRAEIAGLFVPASLT